MCPCKHVLSFASMILLKMKISFYDFFFSFLGCFFSPKTKFILCTWVCIRLTVYVCSTTVQGPMKATKKPSHLLELELQSVVSWWLYGWVPGTELWKKMLLPAELSLQRLWIGFYPSPMNLSVLKIQCFFFFFVFVFEFYQLECTF